MANIFLYGVPDYLSSLDALDGLQENQVHAHSHWSYNYHAHHLCFMHVRLAYSQRIAPQRHQRSTTICLLIWSINWKHIISLPLIWLHSSHIFILYCTTCHNSQLYRHKVPVFNKKFLEWRKLLFKLCYLSLYSRYLLKLYQYICLNRVLNFYRSL